MTSRRAAPRKGKRRTWEAWALTDCGPRAAAHLGVWPPSGRLAVFDTEAHARDADDDHVMPIIRVRITEIEQRQARGRRR